MLVYGGLKGQINGEPVQNLKSTYPANPGNGDFTKSIHLSKVNIKIQKNILTFIYNILLI